MEDLYDKIKSKELSDVNKDMFLVMIYRAINTPPFSVLQHIAALPWYGLSAVVNAWESVTKWKIFLESLKGDSINNQLKLLEDIEKEVSERKWTIYQWIREALDSYKQWISVSYIFGKAKNYSEFEQMIKKAGLANDIKIKSLLQVLSTNYDKTKITSFIDSMKWEINSIGTSSGYAAKSWLSEKAMAEVGGMFGHTNFFKETMKNLSKSLEVNSNILRQPVLLNKAEKLIKKLKYAKVASWNVNLLDLSHLTGDIQSLKDLAKDLKILWKHSPELLKFFFRNIPVILLGSDMIKGIKRGEYTEVLKIYTEFVPIVWPIVFASSEYKKGTLSLGEVGGTAVWLGFDGWFVMSMKKRTVLKLLAMPIVDTSKFISNSTDIIARYTKGIWKFETISKLKLKGRMAIAWMILLSFYWLSKYLDKDDLKDQDVISILSRISKKWWLELVNNEIITNWTKYPESLKTQLISAFVWYYMQLDPWTLEKYIDSVTSQDGKFMVNFSEDAKKSSYVQNKKVEIKSIISQLEKKLNIDIKATFPTV